MSSKYIYQRDRNHNKESSKHSEAEEQMSEIKKQKQKQ